MTPYGDPAVSELCRPVHNRKLGAKGRYLQQPEHLANNLFPDSAA